MRLPRSEIREQNQYKALLRFIVVDLWKPNYLLGAVIRLFRRAMQDMYEEEELSGVKVLFRYSVLRRFTVTINSRNIQGFPGIFLILTFFGKILLVEYHKVKK